MKQAEKSEEGVEAANDSTKRRVLVVQLDIVELEELVRGVIRDELQVLEEQQELPSPTALNGDALEQLLTASQLAKVLNCGVRTLKRWLHEGVLPRPLDIPGAKLRWYRPAIKAWLEKSCDGLAAPPSAWARDTKTAWREIED